MSAITLREVSIAFRLSRLKQNNLRHHVFSPGRESLTRRDVYTAEGVINAVYVFAHALTNLHRSKCPGSRSDGLCDAMLTTSPLEWARYLHEVRFLSRSGSMAEVSFDENGDAPSAFNILALDHYLVNKVVRVGCSQNKLQCSLKRFLS